MMWGYGFDGWWMWVPGLIFTLFIVAGIVVAIVLVVRATASHPRSDAPPHQPPHPAPPPDTARRILEERLARGEITPEEFRQLRSTIDESRRT